MCSVYITNYNEIRSILIVIMSIPLSQLKVEQAHKEFNSLVDIVIAKYEQLDSAEFRVVGTLAFNAKSAELDVLFTCMNQLCQKTEPANASTTSQTAILQALKNTFWI